MLRDFSDDKKNELESVVAAAETSGFWSLVDWVQDWFIKDKISDYEGDIKEYHRQIVDKKDTTLAQLENIFAEVYAVDTRYSKTFSTAYERLVSFAHSIASIADVLDPSPADGGSIVLLRSQEALNSALAPINKVIKSERFYDLLRESKNSDEMYMTQGGIIYKGELYPFQIFGDYQTSDEPVYMADPGWKVVASDTNHKGYMDPWKLLLGTFGVDSPGEPEHNTNIYAGFYRIHSGPEGKDFVISSAVSYGASFLNALRDASGSYTIRVTLMQNAAEDNMACIDFTTGKYREQMWQSRTEPQRITGTTTLEDGTSIPVVFNANMEARQEDPWFGTMGLDASGNWVMKNRGFYGDSIIATVPVETPYGTGNMEVDITSQYYSQIYPINAEFVKLIEGLNP